MKYMLVKVQFMNLFTFFRGQPQRVPRLIAHEYPTCWISGLIAQKGKKEVEYPPFS